LGEVLVVRGDGPEAPMADFTLHAQVPDDSPVAGKSIQDAGLRELDGLFLVSVQRGNTQYSAVGPTFQLERGDVLSFAGVVQNFLTFCQSKSITPLSSDDDGTGSDASDDANKMDVINPLSTFTVEAVVRAGSFLENKTAKDAGFRTRYNCSIIGIHRAGDRVQTPKLGQIKLKVGDVLVCVTNDAFDWQAPDTKRDLKPRLDEAHLRAVDSLAKQPSDMHVDAQLMTGRDYLFSMRISEQPKIFGVPTLKNKSVEESGLNNVPGVRVVAVGRGENVDRAVGPEYVLMGGDVVWFAGERQGLNTLRRVLAIRPLEQDDS
jgi:uncharacterized protein with PhoU and TrkA domain